VKKSKKEAGYRLPFEVDSKVDDSLITAHAGVPLAIELFRSLGLSALTDVEVAVKQRDRGLKVSQFLESFFSLWLCGGDRCEDFKRLREDVALSKLIGHDFPAPNTARDFLSLFHEDGLPLWRAGEKASIPAESSGVGGLGLVNAALICRLQEERPSATATLDLDATILESGKRSAERTYEGTRGYQPALVLWSEQDVVVADDFRDGNVPAGCGNVRVLEQALSHLPPGVERIYLRADSALYEHEVMEFCESRGIGYAISADVTKALRSALELVEESEWRVYKEESERVLEWAEVAYVPSDGNWNRDRGCRRYLGVRVVSRQKDFVDGEVVKYFAVVTNRDGDGGELIEWHREKCGTIEHTHHVLKNELSAECLPSSDQFGANAAWFRMNVILYNLLSFLKRAVLPGEFSTARPKRLRFILFNVVGKVVNHAREMIVRLGSEIEIGLFNLVRGRSRALCRC